MVTANGPREDLLVTGDLEHDNLAAGEGDVEGGLLDLCCQLCSRSWHPLMSRCSRPGQKHVAKRARR